MTFWIVLAIVLVGCAVFLVRQYLNGDMLDEPLSDDRDWNVRR